MDAKEFLEKNGLSCLTELIVEDNKVGLESSLDCERRFNSSH